MTLEFDLKQLNFRERDKLERNDETREREKIRERIFYTNMESLKLYFPYYTNTINFTKPTLSYK